MEHNSVKATLGASEVSLASNGHIGKKTSYLVSIRQSYLQFLFDMLDLPFLPTFTDAQFKLKTRLRKYVALKTWGDAEVTKASEKMEEIMRQYAIEHESG